MTTENGRAFNEWLRAQLKAKKMSQRQLAQQSGVDHSTISRLIRGDRMPSLGTATKLARGLREIREDADTSAALGVVSVGPQNPTARVEYALRADECADRAAGAPDHGVLPRRPGAPLRADIRVGRHGRRRAAAARIGVRHGLRTTGGHGGQRRRGPGPAYRGTPPPRFAAPRPAVRPARPQGRT